MLAKDQDIIDKLRGDHVSAGIRKIYTDHFQSVVNQVCAAGGSPEDGADIFQDSVVTLLTKVKTGEFRQESSIGTYLHAIARNNWLHELRTRERRKNREKNYSYSNDKVIHLPEPEKNFPVCEASLLNELLDQLGDGCRRLLRGFYFEKKKMKDLLLEFDYENEQVLRNKKSKCMKKLKDVLGQNPQLIQQLQSIQSHE